VVWHSLPKASKSLLIETVRPAEINGENGQIRTVYVTVIIKVAPAELTFFTAIRATKQRCEFGQVAPIDITIIIEVPFTR
jgi:hypothetical protein